MASLKKPEPVTDGRKAAIIGGGPTGIAAAYFLGRAGDSARWGGAQTCLSSVLVIPTV